MASSAVARETIASLRHQISRIEGRLAERLEEGGEPRTVLRRTGIPERERFATGVETLDALLGGGVPLAGLTEIHGSVMHGAGSAAGFALALVALMRAGDAQKAGENLPVLWIAVQDALAEAGTPYAPGLARHAGLMPRDLLVSRAAAVEDALWIAEEAAGLRHLLCVVVETHGNPPCLDLTATRRLHRRAWTAGRPVFLLRQSAASWPTAAPLRLLVLPAPAAPRFILTGPLDGTIGRPAFAVTVAKSRAGKPLQLVMEWNPDERAFEERPAQDSRSVVSIPAVRPHLPAADGTVVALRPVQDSAAAAVQPDGEQHAPHRRAQRAG